MAGSSNAQVKQIDSWMLEAFESLTRNKGARSLDGVLVEVGETVNLGGTLTRSRCHFVSTDGNKRVRVDALAAKVARQALEYCTPRSRLIEAEAEREETNSYEGFARLGEEARDLFVKADSSGEAGEMLLYLLLEVVLGLPQIFCKMPLKTNSKMHVHGVDGVHGALEPNGRLGLYWGEAKLYKQVSDATRDCFASLAPYLLDDGSGPTQRDLLLLRDGVDTGNEDLDDALRHFFDEDSPVSHNRIIKGACLIGFDLDDYPSPFGEDGTTIVEEVAAQLEKWFAGANKRVLAEKIQSFEIEVFCVPLPDVEEFRVAVRKHLGI